MKGWWRGPTFLPPTRKPGGPTPLKAPSSLSCTVAAASNKMLPDDKLWESTCYDGRSRGDAGPEHSYGPYQESLRSRAEGGPSQSGTRLHVKLMQSCPTLCDPTDCSPPGSSVPGILQARILEWVAMPSSRGSSRPKEWNPHPLRLLHGQVGSLPLAPPGT